MRKISKIKIFVTFFFIVGLICFLAWNKIWFFLRFSQNPILVELTNDEVNCDWEECTAFRVLVSSNEEYNDEVFFLEYDESSSWILDQYDLATAGSSRGDKLRKVTLRGFPSRFSVDREMCGCSGAKVLLVTSDH